MSRINQLASICERFEIELNRTEQNKHCYANSICLQLQLSRTFCARDRGSMRPKTSRLSRSSISNRLRPMSHMSRTIHPARSLSRLDSRPVTSRMSRSSSVTQWTQQRMRRCRAEQLILGQLAEMKRHQIRVGRFSEAVSVKRIAENYNKVR